MIRLTTLYFHCFAGASGDMILGALIDVGVPLDEVRRALGSLAIDPDMIWTERVTRAGIGATKFRVRGEDAATEMSDSSHEQVAHSHSHAGAPSHAHASAHSHTHVSPAEHSHGSGALHSHGHASSQSHPHSHRSLLEINRLIDGSALSPRSWR